MSPLPLFRRYPLLASGLPYVPLGTWPTPLTSAPTLAEAIGVKELWVKRDDLSAPVYGGNKVRKLEFLLAAARNQGCTAVLTYGGLGSNHALATSLYCRQLGLNCGVVLTPEPLTDAVRDTLRYHVMLGTRITVAQGYADVATAGARLRAEMSGEACYEIPFGGSSAPGVLGFVNAAFELADQISTGAMPAPDSVYLACGTAGSAAGLALGLQLAGLQTAIEAVQVTPMSLKPDEAIARLFHQSELLMHSLQPDIVLPANAFAHMRLRADQLGAGYARPTAAAKAAQSLVQAELQLPVSITYTAKALAALIADAQSGDLQHRRVLFWNTYNSHPLPETVARSDWRRLPIELHGCFEHAQRN